MMRIDPAVQAELRRRTSRKMRAVMRAVMMMTILMMRMAGLGLEQMDPQMD